MGDTLAAMSVITSTTVLETSASGLFVLCVSTALRTISSDAHVLPIAPVSSCTGCTSRDGSGMRFGSLSGTIVCSEEDEDDVAPAPCIRVRGGRCTCATGQSDACPVDISHMLHGKMHVSAEQVSLRQFEHTMETSAVSSYARLRLLASTSSKQLRSRAWSSSRIEECAESKRSFCSCCEAPYMVE